MYTGCPVSPYRGAAMAENAIYAIDFGTTNSLIAYADPDTSTRPMPIEPDADDPSIVRSVLYTSSQDYWTIGQKALSDYGEARSNGRLFRSIKKYLPDPGFEGTKVNNKMMALHDMVAIFLGQLRDKANAALEKDITRVVLGRPALFSEDPKKDVLAEKRLETAAKIAGFKEIYFCPEPVAAAFDFRNQLKEPKIVLIADFGGGTSDFTVLKLSQNEFKASDVLGLGGISTAGDAFDSSIMKHFISPFFGSKVRYKIPTGSNVLQIPKHLISKMCSPADIAFLGKKDTLKFFQDVQKWSLDAKSQEYLDNLFTLIEENLGFSLFRSVENSKKDLSTHLKAPFIYEELGIHIDTNIEKEAFNLASNPNVKAIMQTLDQTLEQAGLKNEDIEIVCCTGGTAKINSINTELEKRFGAEKLKQHRNFHSVIDGLGQAARSWYF